MERREITLGDLKVVRSDYGLEFYTKDYENREDPLDGHFWLNESSVVTLKYWLNEEDKSTPPHWSKKENKQIDYKDRCYLDKRKILRQLSLKDEIRNFLDIITDEVHTCIMYGGENFLNSKNSPYKSIKERIGIEIEDLTLWHYIRMLLIDGFIAFEIIYDEKQTRVIDLKLIDPTTIIVEIDQHSRKKYWVQYPDIPSMKRILTDDQIIYISYSNNNISDFHTSYVEELKESYERLKMVESAAFFPKAGVPNVDIMSVKWLSECLNTVSRIPKSQVTIESWIDNKNDNITRYNNFIKRIVNIFKTHLFDKISNLNK